MAPPTARPHPAAPATRARRFGWRQRLGCGCLSLLSTLAVGLVVLEWILRANIGHFLGAPGQALLMYEMDGDARSYRLRPGWTGEQTIDGRSTAIRINASGMRGAALGTKQAGETRIAVFGDSYVFGHGVAEDETIPVQIQGRLRDRFPGRGPITVGNCGVPGQGLRDVVRSIARHRDFAPDVILVVCYMGNDFTDDCREYTAITEGFLLFGGMARAAFESTRFRLTLRYRTGFLLEQALTRYAPALAFDRSQLGPTPAEIAALEHFPAADKRLGCLFFDRRADDALVAKILDRTRAALVAMQELAGPTPILFALLPSKWHVDPAAWRDLLVQMGFDPDAHEFGKARRRVSALARSLGLPVVDLAGTLRNVPDPRAMWLPTDRHLAAPGCRAVATRLAAVVADQLGW